MTQSKLSQNNTCTNRGMSVKYIMAANEKIWLELPPCEDLVKIKTFTSLKWGKQKAAIMLEL